MVDEPKPEDLAKLLAAATNWSRILFDAYSLAVAGFIANILFASGTRPTDRELREMIEAFVPEGDNPPGIHKSVLSHVRQAIELVDRSRGKKQ